MPLQPSFTLGIEEELQVIDPETRELKSRIHQMFAVGGNRFDEQIEREIHEPVIEVGTPVCANIAEAREEVTRLRSALIRLANANGVRIAAAGTHPFSHWQSLPVAPNSRYERVIEDPRMAARANLAFGLHVHVAVEDKDTRIQIMNAARYFLPHVLALSVNSPFWCGNDTRWKSYRAKLLERVPRTGIPDDFGSWDEYEGHIRSLVETGCIDSGRKIWWDVRPHPIFPTLEYRICDVPMRVDETVCLAALFQAITYKLWKLHDGSMEWRLRRALVEENKNRAAQSGLDNKLVDFKKGIEVPTEAFIGEVLAFVEDVLYDLKSRKEANYALEILRHRPGANRQLEVYRETKSLAAVVDYIVKETAFEVPTPSAQ